MISGPVDTIYPWWTWLLPAVLVVTGLVLARWRLPAVAVVAAVAAAQLAGTGVVGFKRWTR